MTDTLYTPNSTQVPLSHPVQIRDSNRTLHMTTNWLILGVAVVLGPSAMFTFVDFTAPFFREAKWPSTSSGSTVAIVSRAKARATHLFVLYRY